MNFEHRVTVDAEPARVWDLLMDIPTVAACVPGVESVELVADDVYTGVMQVKVGSIRLRFDGKVTVTERNPDLMRAAMEASGADRRVGGAIRAKVILELKPREGIVTDLVVVTDAAVLGKLGELGQAVIRKKADQVMEEFTAALAGRLSGDVAPVASAAPAAGPPEATAPKDSVFRRLLAWLKRLLGYRGASAGSA